MKTVWTWICIIFIAISGLITGKADKSICMIGHRGYSSKHVDNTEESFIAAAKHGSGGCETDVRFTKDGKLVLCHNDTADYEDGTSLVVADSTYAQLTAKPLKNPYNKNKVYLCSFERYLEICQEYDLVSFIELKGTFNDQLIKETFNLAKKVRGNFEKCSLQSFSMDNLIRAHKLFPDLPIMLTYGGDGDYHECIKNGFDIDTDYSSLTKEMVKEFHDAGLKVAVWTCNDIFSLNYARTLGVDYIESDIF